MVEHFFLNAQLKWEGNLQIIYGGDDTSKCTLHTNAVVFVFLKDWVNSCLGIYYWQKCHTKNAKGSDIHV